MLIGLGGSWSVDDMAVAVGRYRTQRQCSQGNVYRHVIMIAHLYLHHNNRHTVSIRIYSRYLVRGPQMSQRHHRVNLISSSCTGHSGYCKHSRQLNSQEIASTFQDSLGILRDSVPLRIVMCICPPVNRLNLLCSGEPDLPREDILHQQRYYRTRAAR